MGICGNQRFRFTIFPNKSFANKPVFEAAKKMEKISVGLSIKLLNKQDNPWPSYECFPQPGQKQSNPISSSIVPKMCEAQKKNQNGEKMY